ncbi:hypothetical protein E6H20_04485 [Candidatus Bathyarchaeota archaeon]|nr:MAG: hypothetical protein E6H20_04485 [Candidatus Bathyarchaeota archaeon]
MEFDRFSIALLVLRPDRPRLDKEAEAELQDAHMAHLADHEAGYLLAAGPLLGGPDEAFRGLTILNVEPEKARLLKEQDPAVPCRAVLGQSITLDDATGRDALFSHALPPLDDGGRFRLNNSYRRLGQM